MISTNKYSNLCIDLDFIHLFDEIVKLVSYVKTKLRLVDMYTESMGMALGRIRQIEQKFDSIMPDKIKNSNFGDVFNEQLQQLKEKDAIGSLNIHSPVANFNDLITKYASKNNLDDSLVKAVIKAESGFDPKAVSKAGAQGLMQLMPDTAKSLGVKDSLNPEQNIIGGTKYLKSMMDKFNGNVQKALAAYNAGPGTVDRYGGIPPYNETQEYVTKVLKYQEQY